MSLQTNLKDVRDEFHKDEKLLENAFRLEILWRRYRKYVLVLALCGVGFGAYVGVDSYMRAQKAQAASNAYAKLVAQADDAAALAELKSSSPELYELYRYFNANGDEALYKELATSKNKLIANLAQYELASLKASEGLESEGLEKDKNSESKPSESSAQGAQTGLNSVSQASLKDFAILQEAYLLFKANKIQEAHQKLALIPENSPLANEAKLLKHYSN